MADKESPTNPNLLPQRYGVSITTVASTTTSSGGTMVIASVPLPDGGSMKILNKNIYERALEKSSRKK